MNETGLTTSDPESIRRAQELWRQRKRLEIEQKARKKAARRSSSADPLSTPTASVPNPAAIAVPSAAHHASASDSRLLAYQHPQTHPNTLPHTLVSPVHAKHALSPEVLTSQALASQALASQAFTSQALASQALASQALASQALASQVFANPATVPATYQTVTNAQLAATTVQFPLDRHPHNMSHLQIHPQLLHHPQLNPAAHVSGRVVQSPMKSTHLPPGSTQVPSPVAAAAAAHSQIQMQTVPVSSTALVTSTAVAEPPIVESALTEGAKSASIAVPVLPDAGTNTGKEHTDDDGKSHDTQFATLLPPHMHETDVAAAAAAAAATATTTAVMAVPSVDQMTRQDMIAVSQTTVPVSAVQTVAQPIAPSPAMAGSTINNAENAEDTEVVRLANLEAQRQWREAKRHEIALKRARGSASKRGRKRTKLNPSDEHPTVTPEAMMSQPQTDLVMNAQTNELLSMNPAVQIPHVAHHETHQSVVQEKQSEAQLAEPEQYMPNEAADELAREDQLDPMETAETEVMRETMEHAQREGSLAVSNGEEVAPDNNEVAEREALGAEDANGGPQLVEEQVENVVRMDMDDRMAEDANVDEHNIQNTEDNAVEHAQTLTGDHAGVQAVAPAEGHLDGQPMEQPEEHVEVQAAAEAAVESEVQAEVQLEAEDQAQVEEQMEVPLDNQAEGMTVEQTAEQADGVILEQPSDEAISLHDKQDVSHEGHPELNNSQEIAVEHVDGDLQEHGQVDGDDLNQTGHEPAEMHAEKDVDEQVAEHMQHEQVDMTGDIIEHAEEAVAEGTVVQTEESGVEQEEVTVEQADAIVEQADQAAVEQVEEASVEHVAEATVEQVEEARLEQPDEAIIELAEELTDEQVEDAGVQQADKPETEPADERRTEQADDHQSEPANEHQMEQAEATEMAPAEEAQTGPAEEPQAQPAEEPPTQPAEDPQTQPGEELRTVSTEAPQCVPSEEPQTIPAEEPQTIPAEEPQTIPAEEPQTMPAEEPQSVPADESTTELAGENQTELVEEPQTEQTEEPQMEQASEPQTELIGEPLTEQTAEPQTGQASEPETRQAEKSQAEQAGEGTGEQSNAVVVEKKMASERVDEPAEKKVGNTPVEHEEMQSEEHVGQVDVEEDAKVHYDEDKHDDSQNADQVVKDTEDGDNNGEENGEEGVADTFEAQNISVDRDSGDGDDQMGTDLTAVESGDSKMVDVDDGEVEGDANETKKEMNDVTQVRIGDEDEAVDVGGNSAGEGENEIVDVVALSDEENGNQTNHDGEKEDISVGVQNEDKGVELSNEDEVKDDSSLGKRKIRDDSEEKEIPNAKRTATKTDDAVVDGEGQDEGATQEGLQEDAGEGGESGAPWQGLENIDND